jgi:hypothetical protein
MPSIKTRINSINGLRLVDAEIRRIEFPGPVSDPTLRELLQVLKDNDAEFALYDERYPSASDPGAYFSYSPTGAPVGKWRMTFGNHGWSGGIYEIDDNTICCQLMGLVARGLLKSIELDRVCFFSHYPLERASRSKAMDKELLAIHGVSESRPPS